MDLHYLAPIHILRISSTALVNVTEFARAEHSQFEINPYLLPTGHLQRRSLFRQMPCHMNCVHTRNVYGDARVLSTYVDHLEDNLHSRKLTRKQIPVDWQCVRKVGSYQMLNRCHYISLWVHQNY